MQDLVDSALERINSAGTAADLEVVRVDVLGRKGVLSQLSKDMGKLTADEKVARGKFINAAKQTLETAYESLRDRFASEALQARLDSEWLDLTVPAPGVKPGALHPITQIQWEIEDLFRSLGFSVLDGPEVETEHHNFDALNIPADHPARDMQDTFWLDASTTTTSSPTNVNPPSTATANAPTPATAAASAHANAPISTPALSFKADPDVRTSAPAFADANAPTPTSALAPADPNAPTPTAAPTSAHANAPSTATAPPTETPTPSEPRPSGSGSTTALKPHFLLRTHTSPVQVRGMESLPLPLRMIAPGRVFRNESVDASHEHTFYQLEGMMIDKNVSVGNLIYFMKTLLSAIFKREVTVRLRPGYFPFVEPGFELDIRCLICGGPGCPVCKHSGWVELLPCGLINPHVLSKSGIDPTQWNGFAFGLGLTRLVMMRYAIDDIRWLQSGDLRFLEQFAQ
jgi:phenylalanyl-tRNA synthetase alpha subunit